MVRVRRPVARPCSVLLLASRLREMGVRRAAARTTAIPFHPYSRSRFIPTARNGIEAKPISRRAECFGYRCTALVGVLQ